MAKGYWLVVDERRWAKLAHKAHHVYTPQDNMTRVQGDGGAARRAHNYSNLEHGQHSCPLTKHLLNDAIRPCFRERRHVVDQDKSCATPLTSDESAASARARTSMNVEKSPHWRGTSSAW